MKKTYAAISAVLLLASCTSRHALFTRGEEAPVTGTPTAINLDETVQRKVDILFVVDDSMSMAPKQDILKTQSFPSFAQRIEQFASVAPAWYHIGVVTTSVGAGTSNLPGCPAPGNPELAGQEGKGGGGRLVSRGAAAATGCQAVEADTDGRTGVRYIDLNQLNSQDNLPGGQTLTQTFTCMAAVGDKGCGFESPLEAAYRALRDPVLAVGENAGFLRADAVLVVVFVTDEDDCSAPTNSDLFEASTDKYGTLDSFRCARFGYKYGTAGAYPLPYAEGIYDNIVVATETDSGGGIGMPLYDVSRYTTLFARPLSRGGLKRDPNDVVLLGLFGVPEASGDLQVRQTDGDYTCPAPATAALAPPICLTPACSNPNISTGTGNPPFSADPAYRLAAVFREKAASPSAPSITPRSICSDTYVDALDALANSIAERLLPDCLKGSPLVKPGTLVDPHCEVTDVTVAEDGTSEIETELPWCGTGPVTMNCWRFVERQDCEKVTNPVTGEMEGLTMTTCRATATQPNPDCSADISRTLIPYNTATRATCYF